MKCFDVKAIDPTTGRPCTFKHVPRTQLRQNLDGETVYFYNDHYPDCEVISVKEVRQSELDAMALYFKQYGTACE